MSRVRRIATTVAATAVLLPAVASLCLACMPCDATATASTTAHEAEPGRAATPCHTPAEAAPELVAACCCDGDMSAATVADEPRMLSPAVSWTAPAVPADTAVMPAAPRLRGAAVAQEPPRSGRDRLSLHRVLLI